MYEDAHSNRMEKKPHWLSTKDLDEHLPETPEESPRHQKTQGSRAYAAAMRALQDKIRLFDAENARLKEKLREADLELGHGKAQSNSQSATKEREHSLMKEVSGENKQLRETIAVQQAQIDYLEASGKMSEDQYSITRENLNLQIEQLHKELRERKRSFVKLETEKKAAEDDRDSYKGALGTYKAEIEFLRKTQGNRNSCEPDFAQKIRELQGRNKALTALNTKQDSQLELLRKELGNSRKISKKKKKLNKPSTDHLRSKSESPHSQSNRHIGAHLLPQVTSKENLLSREDDIEHLIGKYETELHTMSYKYKGLLRKSQAEAIDLASIRKELNSLSNKIEKRSRTLFDLKKRQQSLLKHKLLS